MSALARVAPYLLPLLKPLLGSMTKRRFQFLDFTREKVLKRVNKKTDRKDFMTDVLQAEEIHSTSEAELCSNAETLLYVSRWSGRTSKLHSIANQMAAGVGLLAVKPPPLSPLVSRIGF